MLSLDTVKLANPPKSRSAGPTFPFLHFGGLYMLLFGHLHSRNPELQIPEILITFRKFGSCYVLMIDLCIHEIPNPETPKCSTSFRNFGKYCVLMSDSCTRETPNPKTPKCWPQSFHISDFGKQQGPLFCSALMIPENRLSSVSSQSCRNMVGMFVIGTNRQKSNL
jgi:hypothetical protein